jgi:hypothetical protein
MIFFTENGFVAKYRTCDGDTEIVRFSEALA